MDGTGGNDTFSGTTGNDSYNGLGGDDTLNGGLGNDSLNGGSGNDTLNGGAGADTMIGGLGDDTFIVDNIGDVVQEDFDGGSDTVKASISYTLGDNIENLILSGSGNINGVGNDLDNSLTGNAGNNTLDGGIGADTMSGLGGNDVYVVDNGNDVIKENAGGGIDTVLASVSYAASDNVENLTLTGSDNIDATGNALGNVLRGNSGNNILDGGLGGDTMSGGLGDDTYVVDSKTDVVSEAANAGNDTVLTTLASYTLGANVENLSFTGTGKFSGTGNTLANMLAGGDGNDTLNGGIGADTLTGAGGDDTFIVDNIGDVVQEESDGGIDTVKSSVSFILGDNLENLVLSGNGSISGTGNDLDNILTGNAGNNILDGGVGADTMSGGAGNDSYIVDDENDVIKEAAGGGIDTVLASANYTLASNVENLTLTGSDDIDATGNNMANIITGNDGINILTGGAGNDTYIVQNEDDEIVEAISGGIDTVQASVSYGLSDNVENLTLTGSDDIDATGNALGNVLRGNSGNNILDGGLGNDTMSGGLGDDTYVVDSRTDVVSEVANAGNDTIQTTLASYTLGVNVENLSFTGTGDFSGIGNSLANMLDGGDGNDTLSGGGGADTLTGGVGDDTYIVTNGASIINEDAAGGTDTVKTSVSYTLGDNLENLILSGSGSISGTGNDLDNSLIGNAGNNTLAGGAGNDTLSGGTGNDTYYFSSGFGTDTITKDASNVNDTLYISNGLVPEQSNGPEISQQGSDLEIDFETGDTLIVQGWFDGAQYQVGNITTETNNGLMQAKLLVGKDTGADTLTGGSGKDIMYGLGGNDYLSGAAGNDELNGGAGDDTLSGGAGNDILTDFSGANLLDGGAGDDYLTGNGTLRGGLGNDTYAVSADSYAEIDNSVTSGGNGNDNVVFMDEGITKDSFSYALDGNDLVLTNLDTGNVALRFDNWNLGTAYQVEMLNFQDTTTLSASELTALANGAVIAGTIGSDTLTGTAGPDKIYGDAGDDLLDGAVGNDSLDGGAGNDTMYGGAGDDTLISGGGSISGGDGNDTYVVGDSFNNIVIDNFDSDGGFDTLRLTATPMNFDFSQDGSDLVMTYKGSDRTIRLSNWFDGPGSQVDQISFGGGVNVTNEWLTNLASGGADNVYVGDNNSNYLQGDSTGARLYGMGGDDCLTESGGTMEGGEGNDTYQVMVTDGALTGDVVINNYDTDGGNDKLFFVAADNSQTPGSLPAFNDFSFDSSGNDLVMTYTPNGHTITVKDWFADVKNQLDAIYFPTVEGWSTKFDNADINALVPAPGSIVGDSGDNAIAGTSGADIIHGLAGNDTIDGGDGNDTIDGGAGDDIITGGAGNDHYIFGGWSGNDTIVADSGNSGDTIVFGPDTDGAPQLSRGDSDPNDLVMTFKSRLDGSTETLTLQGWFDDQYKITNFQTNNATMVIQNAVIGTADDDTLSGDSRNDFITGGDGADTLWGNAGDDLLFGGGGDDVSYGGAGNDHIEDSIGNNQLYGGDGNDTLMGGVGNDTLSGGSGADLYQFDGASGNDVILKDASNNLDTLEFGGGSSSPVLSKSGSALVLTLTDKTQPDLVSQLTIQGWYDGSQYQISQVLVNKDDTVKQLKLVVGDNGNNTLAGTTGNDALFGLAGNDVLSGGNGNDELYGGGGNDTLTGGGGTDSYEISNTGNAIDGNDHITNSADNSLDSVMLEWCSSSDVTAALAGNDLVLSATGGGSVTLDGWALNSANRVNKFEFSDGRYSFDGNNLTRG